MTTRLAVDLMSGQFYAGDPHEAFTWMRRHEPVYHDEANDLWGIASYQDVRALGTDPSLYSNAGGIRPKFPATPMMIDTDPPQHTRRRKLVSAGFSPRRIAAMTEHVRRVRPIRPACRARSRRCCAWRARSRTWCARPRARSVSAMCRCPRAPS